MVKLNKILLRSILALFTKIKRFIKLWIYIKILDDSINTSILLKATNIELNPKTGKSEYLLGIIYLDIDQSNLGCNYLLKAKSKGFKFPDGILNQFCEEK